MCIKPWVLFSAKPVGLPPSPAPLLLTAVLWALVPDTWTLKQAQGPLSIPGSILLLKSKMTQKRLFMSISDELSPGTNIPEYPFLHCSL